MTIWTITVSLVISEFFYLKFQNSENKSTVRQKERTKLYFELTRYFYLQWKRSLRWRRRRKASRNTWYTTFFVKNFNFDAQKLENLIKTSEFWILQTNIKCSVCESRISRDISFYKSFILVYVFKKIAYLCNFYYCFFHLDIYSEFNAVSIFHLLFCFFVVGPLFWSAYNIHWGSYVG